MKGRRGEREKGRRGAGEKRREGAREQGSLGAEKNLKPPEQLQEILERLK